MDPKPNEQSRTEKKPEEMLDFDVVFGKSTKDHKESWVRNMGRENSAIVNIKMTCLKDLLGRLNGDTQCKRDDRCVAPLHICKKFFHKPGEERCTSKEVIHQDENGIWLVHIPPYCSSLLSTAVCGHTKNGCPYAQFGWEVVRNMLQEANKQKERIHEAYAAGCELRPCRPID